MRTICQLTIGQFSKCVERGSLKKGINGYCMFFADIDIYKYFLSCEHIAILKYTIKLSDKYICRYSLK